MEYREFTVVCQTESGRPAFNWDHNRAILVPDVHRTEIPAVDLDGLAVIRRSVSLPFIKRIGFHQITVGNMLQQRLLPVGEKAKPSD
jgi:hypothetical protein